MTKSNTTKTRTLLIPIQSWCAKCGPVTGRRRGWQRERHHVELLHAMLDSVPGWTERYIQFHEEDCVDLCKLHHYRFETDFIQPLLQDLWYPVPTDYRTTDLARNVASAASTQFWNWLEEDSWAKRTKRLRWTESPDPTHRDILRPERSSGTR